MGRESGVGELESKIEYLNRTVCDEIEDDTDEFADNFNEKWTDMDFL